jgi:hypothetical protein
MAGGVRISGDDAASRQTDFGDKKGSLGCLVESKQPLAVFFGAAASAAERSLLGAEVGEFVAKLLDAATQRIDALLRAGVERMRFAGRFELEERKLLAIVHLDRFTARGAGTRHELETVRQIHEADVAVRGVNAFFHREPRR